MDGWPEGSIGESANEPVVARGRNKPIAIQKPGTPEYESSVNKMAGRIVDTYVASAQDRHVSQLGEHFYAQDAHGAAHAISSGVDPDSRLGKLYRRAPVGAKGRPDQNVERLAPDKVPGINRAAGTLARLSPQTPWDKNIRQAWQAHNIDPDGPVMQNVRDHVSGKGARGTIPGDLNAQPSANIVKAVDIAHGRAEVEDHVHHEGKDRVKVGSFYNNITHPSTSTDTTVDFRHHDVAYGKLMDTSENRALGTPSRYRMVEEATNRATDQINRDHAHLRVGPEPLRPHDVQAVAWWGDKKDVDRRMAEYPGAQRTESSTNFYRVPSEGHGMRSLHREDLGKPLGQ